MTYNPAPAARLRHILVVDAAALVGAAEHTIERLADRIQSIRDHTLLVLVEDGDVGGMPEPDYVVARDGSRIIRMPTGDELEDWPPEPDGAGLVAAVGYLAEALLVPPSDVYVIAAGGSELIEGEVGDLIVVGGAPEPAAGRSVPHPDELVTAFDDLRLFRLSLIAVSEVADEAFEAAKESLRRNITELGFTAASLADNPLSSHDANYAAVWARDGVVTGLWTLCLDDPELTDCFRQTLRVLARHQSPTGQIPANVRLEGEQPDYSGIGGIGSIDSVLWFVIGAVRFAFFTGDREFAEEMRSPVERAMTWLGAHDANNDGLIEIPEASDWMDLFPRSYNVLYDEVLWYQACRDTASLLEALSGEGDGWRTHSERIATRISELFWTSGETLMELAADSSGVFSTGEGHYMLSQVTPFDYGWRCDVYANLLASLTGLLDEHRSERLFRFLWGVGINDPYPVRCLYPAIISGAEDWKDYFLVNFLNLPDHYHNGGIWPFIGGLWVRFLVHIGRVELAHRELNALAESCRVGMYGDWEFNEWLHGRTGRPMGKAHQAWSAASFVKAYVSLHDPSERVAFAELDAKALAE